MKYEQYGTVAVACAFTSGSNVITPSAMTSIAVGQVPMGTGIAAGTVVLEVRTATIVVSQPVTATSTNNVITFSNPEKTFDGFTVGFDKADYGGTFTNYTPPTPDNGIFELRVVNDTNGGGAFKLYIYAGGAWKSATIA